MNIEARENNNLSSMRRLAGILGIVYVLLFFAGNFPTGVGDAFFGIHSPAEVVTWAAEHESAVRLAIFVDLLNELLFVVFVVLLVRLTDSRSLAAVLAYVGIGVSTALWAIVLGLQGSVPELARLAATSTAAQAAVVLQGTIEFSLRQLPYAMGLAAVGYLLARGRSFSPLPRAFGLVLTVVPTLMAISFPLKTVSDLWHSLETASSIGLLLWIVVASAVLLLRSGPRAEPRTAQLQFQP